MKLYIDTSSSDKIVVGLDQDKFETQSRQDKSQKLLPFIDELLKKKKKKIEDITEIEVNTGPGSFTGLRVGVSVANTFGWVLGIPVNGKNIAKGEIKHQFLSAQKARDTLGWKSKYTLEEGLKETVKWYKTFFEEQNKHE